jgi:zinc protease
MKLQGREKVGGQDTYVIEATADDGTVEKWYFSAPTGLLVRSDTPYVTDDGNSFLQTIYEDYRDVDGVKLPFVWRQSSPDFDYVIRFNEIRNNVPVDDSKFEKPKA